MKINVSFKKSEDLYYYDYFNPQIGKIVDQPNEYTSKIPIPKDEKEGHPSMYMLGVSVTVLAAGAFVAANIISFPFAGPVSLLALGILSAVSYGIVNDQLACRQCIHYFTVGHTSIHKRLLKTENPTLNGVVWGIHATWKLGVVAGLAMASSALITGLVVSKIMPFLMIANAAGITGVCIYAHIKAKQREAASKIPENKKYIDNIKNLMILPKPGYHPVNLQNIPEDKLAAFEGVGERNNIGYKFMPCLGAVEIIGIIALGILL